LIEDFQLQHRQCSLGRKNQSLHIGFISCNHITNAPEASQANDLKQLG
jgi:hypothetical protein